MAPWVKVRVRTRQSAAAYSLEENCISLLCGCKLTLIATLITEWLVASQKVDGNKVFVYQLGYAPSFLGVVSEILYWYEWCPRWPLPCKQMAQHMGVGHTADVPLVWGGPKAILNATDQQVSRQMIDLWHGLAHTGWPSSLWHSYAVANETAQLAIRFSLVHNGKAEECAVWAHARSLKP